MSVCQKTSKEKEQTLKRILFNIRNILRSSGKTDDKAKYADWSSRNDIKNQLRRDLVILLHSNGFPSKWNNEIFEQVLEQA
ncbi:MULTISPECIES: type I restriction enzyme endonuclease domain-containing protein [Mammaliicoccus]|uniref:type I restriction enzyme endonuclease domain-containing protein n=1 Tax=Mammaliicoccus TaxID=2803850 RepID=UPI0038B1DB14|nr:DUF3387 domain-containing protein [Mammaliicoccus sciuri]MCD8779651.1 DUF3387 domain-containing protein [Mammaliicoccus sciuri]